MRSWRLLLVLLVVQFADRWHWSLGRSVRDVSWGHYCGSQLADMVQQVCGAAGIGGPPPANINHGRPNSLTSITAGKAPTKRRELARTKDQLQQDSNSSSIGSQHQTQPAGRRRKRGIVEECCKKSCSFETLSQYCN